MKNSMKKRVLAAVLAVFMVVGIMPVSMFVSEKVFAAGDKVYTFESKDLTAFAAGAKADGDTEKAGTDNYFTLIYSAKSKVDSSSKKFADDYESAQRVNFGGKAGTDKNAFKFTTSNEATVKIWWAEGGDDNRQVAILNANGEPVATTSDTVEKNAVAISTLTLKEAGTYYLGGDINNNYFFKLEVSEKASVEPTVNEYAFESKDLTAFAAGAKADGDTEKAGTNNFFTLIYSAKSKVDSSSKKFEDDYESAQRVNFGGKAGTDKNAIKFTTEGSATVKVWWAEGGDDNRQVTILDANGEPVATTSDTVAKNAVAISTLKLENPGTYYLGGDINNNYFFKVVVTDVVGEGAPVDETTPWEQVANPVLGRPSLKDANTISIPYTMLVGKKGADAVNIIVKKGGEVVKTINSVSEGPDVVKDFAPSESGTYEFSIEATRESETTVKTGNTASIDFILPLTNSSIGVCYNKGAGVVSLEWTAVKEATSYVVEYSNDGDNWTAGATTDALTADVSGLTAGKEYQFRIKAVRGTDESFSDVFELKITEEEQNKWGYIVYGNGASASNAAYSGNINEDGKVTLRSGAVDATGKLKGSGNNGKIVPASYDGLNFYYTAIPTSKNFTLRAKVTVDQWSFSNAQEGFGVMVTDQLGGSGWNNQYQAIVSKTEYYYDEDNDEVTTDSSRMKVTQKLGVSSYEKRGITPDNIDLIEKNDTDTLTKYYITSQYPLEQRYPYTESKNGNLIGNAVNADSNENITEMYLTIQRNNTGFFVTYESIDGSYSMTKKYYDRDALSKLDEDYIYAGFFTARYAQATFSDVTFTTINPEDDAPVEVIEDERIVVNEGVKSPKAQGTNGYVIQYSANCDGHVTFYDENDEIIMENVRIPANTVVDIAWVELHEGKNSFRYVFAPSDEYDPGEYKVMDSFDMIEGKLSVVVRKYGDSSNTLYCAPDCVGSGSKEDPMSIYDAVKFAQPGQTIVLMEGTYLLDKTVKVERGIDGTTDQKIKMIADPDAKTRPVLDFQGLSAGMVLAGNNWYFQGFDVTNSADGQKGIQVSGNLNTLDNINAYHNGNTGIQISRYLTTDEYDMWPAHNLILNCTSYGNADSGYEDADGFAAKLTVADGNVFDGCVAYNNADDGWDLFAKVQSGSIGSVTIRNCVAYGNGYLEDGTVAGNGNGFKMGGDSMYGGHVLEDSIAFNNKAKGIDSNSCPDNIIKNCTSFNNESYNVALYTNIKTIDTNYQVDGVISYRSADFKNESENLKPQQAQKLENLQGVNNFYWDSEKLVSANVEGLTVADDWFVSTNTTYNATTHKFDKVMFTRNADNSINMNGLFELTEKAPLGSGAMMGGVSSKIIPLTAGIDTYKVIEGGNVRFVGQTSQEVTMRIDAPFELFEGVMVDDVLLDPSKYTAYSGSTVVTFPASWVGKLSISEHTIRFLFSDGKFAESKIIIEPVTGDSTPLALYIAIAAAGLLAFAGLFVFEKKRKATK